MIASSEVATIAASRYASAYDDMSVKILPST